MTCQDPGPTVQCPLSNRTLAVLAQSKKVSLRSSVSDTGDQAMACACYGSGARFGVGLVLSA